MPVSELDEWSVGRMAALFSPREAAQIKYQVHMLRCLDSKGARYMDRVTADDGGHRWFTYCLDAVARRELAE